MLLRGVCKEGEGREVFVSKKINKNAHDLLFRVSNDNISGFGL